MVDLDPTRGHEQAGRRPALVVSVDKFNHGPADLVVILPLTTKVKGTSFNVEIDPPAGGLKQKSFAKCDDIRCVAKGRLLRRWGSVPPAIMAAVEFRLRILLGL
jgi:mRNA interferase MazF